MPGVGYRNTLPGSDAVTRLNAAATRGNVALAVWFCSRIEPDRSWAVREDEFFLPSRYLPGVRGGDPGSCAHYYSLPVGLPTRDRPDQLVFPSPSGATAAPRRAR